MKNLYFGLILAAAAASMFGCSLRAPTISNVHIGHAMTGWHDTPGKEGLFVVAEKKAAEALSQAGEAVATGDDLNGIQSSIARVSLLTAGAATADDSQNRYGLKQGLNGAVSHITFAATSPDATTNTKAFAEAFAVKAAGVFDRCDLIVALSGDILTSASVEEAVLLAPEVEKLARANVHGEDLDGDGRIGSSPSEYGLVQLRREIEGMLAREDPPYRTVSSWYLFNLIRLPDGSWIFRKRSQGGSVSSGY